MCVQRHAMSYYVVDRIEGTMTVVVGDDGRGFDVPRRDLPKGVKEGTVLRVDAKGADRLVSCPDRRG